MNDNITEREIIHLIFEFRGYKVMIDSDLSTIYGVTTKALKRQVKRNTDRFPSDFMFVLDNDEKGQLVTNCDRLKNLKHSSVNPWFLQSMVLPCCHPYFIQRKLF